MIRKRFLLAAGLVGVYGLTQISLLRSQDVAPSAGNGNYPRLGVLTRTRGGMEARLDHDTEAEISEAIGKLTTESDADKKTELEKAIKAKLGQQFDARQAVREAELKVLEDRVKDLRQLFDKRQKAKDDIIQNRLQQLLRASNGLDWAEGAEGYSRSMPGYGKAPVNRTSQPGYQAPSAAPLIQSNPGM